MMFPGMPGNSNTISNSSTIRGWLESTGLDDIFLNTCTCIFGVEEPPPSLPGDRRGVGGGVTTTQPQAKGVGKNKRVIKAGTTVDGTPLLIQDTPLGIFGLAPVLGGRNR